MRKSEKIFVGLLVSVVLLFLLVKVIIPFSIWLNPDPITILSRMERRDPKAAQEIMDNYAEELEAVAAATEFLEVEEGYSYKLNCTDEYAVLSLYEGQSEEMPQELMEALRYVEEKFPECEEKLLLKKEQLGVRVTIDGSGFSYLCYPSGKLISHSVIEDERGTRCLDMGGGWELQMYYAPGG